MMKSPELTLPQADYLERKNVSIWGLLRLCLKTQPWTLLVVISALLGLSLVNAALVFVVGPLIKVIVSTEQSKFGLAEFVDERFLEVLPKTLLDVSVSFDRLIIVVPLTVVVVAVVRSLMLYLYQVNHQKIALSFGAQVREVLWRKIMGLSYRKLSRLHGAELMSLMMNDVQVLQTRFGEMWMNLIRDLLMVLSALGALCFISVNGAIIFSLSLPILFWFLGRAGSGISNYAEEWQRLIARMALNISQIRQRLEFIVAQLGQRFEMERFDKLNKRIWAVTVRSLRVRTTVAPFVEWIGFLIFAATLKFIHVKYGGSVVGDSQKIIQLLAAVGLSVRPLRSLGEQWVRLGEAQGASQSIIEMLRSEQDEAKSQTAVAQEASPIEFPLVIENAKFSWSSAHQLSLSQAKFESGSVHLLRGVSGAGKSTFLRGLGGLLNPDQWQGSAKWQELANVTSYCAQSPMVFKGSMRENLAYGNSKFEQKLCDEVLEALQLKDLIEGRSGGLDSILDPNQLSVSGGQLIRINLARSLLKPAQLYLLDEVLAAVESHLVMDILNFIRANVRQSGAIAIISMHEVPESFAFDSEIFVQANGQAAQELGDLN
jgi:ABC-type multidrug transport system fused ATPase/permease subunit